MTHVFQQYFRKHGHYPRLSVDSGIQRLTVEFAPGYVLVKTSPPMGGQIYLTRSAWFKFLKKVLPLSRKWAQHPYPDFDVPQAENEYFLAEMHHLDELRAQKRSRKQGTAEDHQEALERRERQKARHAKAAQRAARKRSDSET